MTTEDARRRGPYLVKPRENAAPVAIRAGMTALPAASFGATAPRRTASAPAVAMKMPR